MADYIATFHTHLAALRSRKALCGKAHPVNLAPVPRSLSSSCGTCIRYTAEEDYIGLLDPDFEQVVEVVKEDEYRVLKTNI